MQEAEKRLPIYDAYKHIRLAPSSKLANAFFNMPITAELQPGHLAEKDRLKDNKYFDFGATNKSIEEQMTMQRSFVKTLVNDSFETGVGTMHITNGSESKYFLLM